MPLPSGLSFLGVSKETTKGTFAAATAYIPVSTMAPADVIAYINDTGMRGSMVDIYNVIGADGYSTFDVSGPVFPDTVGWFLFGILGDLVTTGASAPFSHVGAVKNSTDGQPKSLSLSDHYGAQGGTPDRGYPGMQVGELDLKFQADGLFEYDAKLTGFLSSLVAKPTTSFTSIPPVPAWALTATIAGSTKTFIESGNVDLKRSIVPIGTVDGNQTPYAVWVGPLAVSGKLSIVVEDETEITRYLNNTTAAVVLDLTQGASAALIEVKLQMSKVQYTMVTYKRDKDYLEADITYTAVGNTTDVGASGGFSQIKATLQNAIASGVYQ